MKQNLNLSLGVARIESVPTGADVLTPDGRNLGQTPLEVPDLSPQPAQFNLALRGYEPGSVSVVVVANQTTTARANLLSLRYSQALAEARQYMNAGNYEAVLQAAGEALALKSDSGEAVALQTTATANLKAARQRADAAQQQAEVERQRKEVEKQRVEAEQKQTEIVRQNAERLKQPGLVFTALCARNPDTLLFTEHELKTSKPANEVEVRHRQIVAGGTGRL